jgi:hypothetical protein
MHSMTFKASLGIEWNISREAQKALAATTDLTGED